MYSLFPNLKERDLYITGESYAGKYVPSFSYKIYQENKILSENKGQKINLKGLAIGDGLIDPVSQTEYGDVLYNIGLIDFNQKLVFQDRSKQTRDAIANKDWMKAFTIFDQLLNGDINPSLFTNMTGYTNYFNFLRPEQPKDFEYFTAYLEQESTRKGIHVGNLSFSDEALVVEKHLLQDMMQSVKPALEELLDSGYKVLIYNGQLDIIVATSLTVNMVNNLDWKGKEDFQKAERKQ
ncbi:probable serine carboxypeptidase CPVL isoform X2 [Eurytemora carolleeae]|nr:probable serine carboxypeptidase CPVL isoform X2 [Eurytemora carolleeae]|eukprot:XP_023329196.1 probable serine carboxypeptidase CPVL isoform X2 [Eurytemora affinis]